MTTEMKVRAMIEGNEGPVLPDKERVQLYCSIEDYGDGDEISPWLKEEVVEIRNQLVKHIQIGKHLNKQTDQDPTNLSLLRQRFPLVDRWADELRESRKRKK